MMFSAESKEKVPEQSESLVSMCTKPVLNEMIEEQIMIKPEKIQNLSN